MIIVIDGPSGSGKSSTAKAVADRLNIEYMDSGALYRVVTLLYIRCDKDFDVFFRMLKPEKIDFRYENESFRVWLDGEEVTDEIRSAEVSEHVSEVAARQRVREFVNNLMHDAIEQRTYIAEGRDLGTAVFPDAALKFFMTADVDTRARRRYKELDRRGVDIDYEEVRANILSRDEKDSERDEDPLKKAEEAIEIDTSSKTFEQQVEEICSYVSDHIQKQ